ncbi:hypothetical protein PTKIN_Ptkin17bG0043100 [Pterospermum kingtungense]
MNALVATNQNFKLAARLLGLDSKLEKIYKALNDHRVLLKGTFLKPYMVTPAASMTLILGYYGSMTLQLGPNCSGLIQANSFFVQSIKVEELDKQKPGLMVNGLPRPPPSDVEISWVETRGICTSEFS